MTIIPSSFSNLKISGNIVNQETAALAKSKRSEALLPQETSSDRRAESSLRPKQISEYVGQSRLKAILVMSIGAAIARKEPLDHILFYGPPGLGKTTLANIIAYEMGSRIHITTGPSLERPRDIIGLVNQLAEGDLLFIDEIHRLNHMAEELLYPAMEDFVIDLTTGKGHATRSMRLPIPRFTLIGATTRAAALSNALRDRFGFTLKLEFYSACELGQIVSRTAKILGLTLDDQAIDTIAQRARGTPRIANRLVRLLRDYAQYKGQQTVNSALAVEAMEAYQIDACGLDPTDRRFLLALVDNYSGGPVGIDTLAATLGEDTTTLEDVYEPFLIQKGFLQRTLRGRIATAKTYLHLKQQLPAQQLSLGLDANAALAQPCPEQLQEHPND